MFRSFLIALLGFVCGIASGIALIIWQEDRLRRLAAQFAAFLKLVSKEPKK